MILDLNNATAIVETVGISLSCLTDDGKCQIAFVRPPAPHNHELILKICPEPENSTPGYDLDLRPGSRLIIEAVNPVFSKCDFYTADSFERLSTENDPKDYRWVVDMDNEIHGGVGLGLKRPGAQNANSRISLLEVNHALFYNAAPTQFATEKVLLGDNRGTPFGILARTVGGLIKCEDAAGSGVRLRNAGQDNGIFLKHEPGVTYTISFTNLPHHEEEPSHGTGHPGSMEEPHASEDKSDFPMFYDVLSSQNGREFDLRPIKDQSESIKRVCERAHLYNISDLSGLLH